MSTTESTTTDLPEPTTKRPVPGQLTFTAPRRGKPPKHLADFDLAGRQAFAKELGLPAFRAKQLSNHYFERFVADPAEMTDLPKNGREEMVAQLMPTLLTSIKTLVADGGNTLKQVHRLFDGALVESVIMRYPGRVTMCISSQAGCGMNCPFCATGQEGLTRNMSTAEIVDQVVAANRMLAEAGDLSLGDDAGAALGAEADDEGESLPSSGGRRVTNVVFMGMGEALANYKAAIGAIRRMVDPSPEGLGMSARGITMSSVGLVTGIDRLTEEGIPVTLALSLHAPDDELRDELVPINTRFKVDEAIDAAERDWRKVQRELAARQAALDRERRDATERHEQALPIGDRAGLELRDEVGRVGAQAGVDDDGRAGELSVARLLGRGVFDAEQLAR